MDSKHAAPQTPLAIVGMACLFPKADGLGAYWANIRRGVDGITEVPPSHWSPEDYFDADPKKPDHTYGRRGGFLDAVDFNPAEFGMAPNALEATDASQLLGLVVAQQALKDAGYGPERAFDRNRTSVVLGVTGTLQLVIPLGARLGHPVWRQALKDAGIEGELQDQIVERIADGFVPWQESSFPGLLGNVVAGRIANRLDLGGTNCVVDAACGSSLSAAHLATLELETGRADMVITGGVDTFNDIFMYMCFSKTPALSPTGDARPFDAQGDGTILGEGLGMVVLKRLADAERDGDTIYAVLRGVGASSDGRGKAIYAPSSDGQREALKKAYAIADVSPETIELVEAHGTGTKVGDAVEVAALAEVYRAAKPDGQWAALGSVKSQIGHTKAAAGVAGMIKAAMALHHKVLPATQKVREPLGVLEGSPFYLNTQMRPWLGRAGHPRRAAVSALGFGGANFHAVLEEHTPTKAATDWDGWVEIISLSADSATALEAALGKFQAGMGWNELRLAAFDARTAFSAAHPHRLTLVVEKDATDLAALVASAKAQLKTGKAHWATPDGAFYGSGAPDGRLGVLFPGQGAQYVGMGRDLFCQFPAMFDVLGEATQAFGETEPGSRLSDRLFPAPAWSADEKTAQEAALRVTNVAQPAIGAMSLGAYRVLEGFGLAPHAVAGHSYGELVALCVAKRLSPEDFYALSCLRGRLMAGDGGDRGGMLAVQAPLAEVEALVSSLNLDVVLANKNAPSQGVLSGATEAVDQAEAACKKAGLKAVRLPVGAAFHSALVADAAKPFRAALESVTLAPAAMAVYANTTGGVYPDSEAEARDLLGHQLAKPVEFVAEIEAMYASGVRTFLEVGPGARMSGLVKAILGDRPFHVVALDSSNGRRSGTTDLARTLAQLAALGYELHLAAWEGGEATYARLRAATKKPAMAVPISGVNHRSKAPAKGPLPARLSAAKPAASAPASLPQVAAAPAPMPAPVNGNGNGNGHGAAYSNGNGHGHAPVNGTPNGHAAPARTVAPVAPAPAPRPVAAPAAGSPLVAEALRATQESMAALQRMQEQTAQLHRQFLQGQESTQQAFRSLVEQQQHVITQAMGAAPATYAPAAYAPAAYTPAVAPAPAPVVHAPVAPAPVPVAASVPVAVAAAPARPAPAPVTAAVAAPVAPAADVEGALLSVVAEKTGYPVEMLNQDMDMESDLGIDSIKRVEILSALQEKLPEAPVIKPEHLGTLRTLRQISAFLAEGMPQRAAAVAPAVAPVAVAAAPGVSTDRIQSVLLGVVADKTGYPVEMLNLDMDMESDLGIDSIKRVEILSALQEQLPEAPVIKPEHLGTLRTLRQIIGFLGEGMATPAAPAAPAAVAPVATSAGTSVDRVQTVLLDVVADKTGYPVEMLNLDMDMESDLGIDSIKRVEILSALQEQLPEAPAIKPEHLGTLRTLRQMIDFMGAGMPAVAPAAPVAQAAASSAGLAPNQVETVLVAIVADKTGYPAEMLNLDMDMESDLGIDSIKRVEILSAVQEQLPEAPAITPEHLGTLRTLRQMIVFLAASPVAAPAPVAAPTPSAPMAAPVVTADAISRQVLGVADLSPTRPALTVPAGAELWIADEGTAVGQALVQRLQDAGYKPQLVSLSASAWPAASQVAGLILLAPEREATEALWAEEQVLFLKRAFGLTQHVRSALVAQGKAGGAFFTTVSRLDGAFGLRGRGQGDATTGGLAGLAKSARHEWPEVGCKALDVAASWNNAPAIARAIADECFMAGPAEVGLAPDGRVTPVLTETALDPNAPAPLAPGDVVVVSGGARGVTAEAAIALGRRFQPTLVLLGRSPLPEAEPAWLAGLTAEGEIKSALSQQPDGPKTPKLLQEAYQRVAADREVRGNLARLEATGARVIYQSVDVRDEAAVRAILATVRAEFGPIRGLVHGAGVLADKLIADKTPEQFAMVFDTKVQGLKALLKAVGGDELKAVALFSSVTGREGRKGQSDYAVANEVLNKVAQQLAANRPACRVVSVNWGPWDGGMVTPALKRLFASEGVGVVPLEAGAAYLADELCQGPGAPVEVLVMGRPAAEGRLIAEGAESPAPKPTVSASKPSNGNGRVKKAAVAFTRELDVARYPFLASHVINGKAVLPAAVMVEWMAHGALHANPGMAFAGLEDFRVYKGVILGAAGAANVRVTTASAGRADGLTRVEVELRGGDADVLHAQATVLLANALTPKAETAVARPAVAPYDMTGAYGRVLFHGHDFQGITAVEGCSAEGIVATVSSAPDPRAWMAQPLRDTWLADPLALDAAFQLMILWSVANEDAPCLPCYAESYRQYRTAFPADGVTVVANVRSRQGNQLVTDFAFLDAQGGLVAELLGAEATIDGSLKAAFRNNSLVAVKP